MSSMDTVMFLYVINGKVIEGPMSYQTVLARTGLGEDVGIMELMAVGYLEYIPPQTAGDIEYMASVLPLPSEDTGDM